MLWILVKKEILETILDLRFTVASLLCLVFIPLGMYVNRVDYEQRLSTYQREHQLYRDRYGDKVSSKVEAQGFRPPAVMSIFAAGLDAFVPDKVTTTRLGIFNASKEEGIDNPLSLLFGKADFLFNVTFLVSLAALIFTFNAITGEKERGTLCLQVANPVSRSQILIAKILGSYLALMVPFIISVALALLLLDASPVVSLGHASVFWPVLLILAATFLFTLAMVTLGVCVSSFSPHSSGVIVRLFLAWVILVLIVPGACSMVAEALLPVESEHVVGMKKRQLADTLREEFEEERKAIQRSSYLKMGLQVNEDNQLPIIEVQPGEDYQMESARVRELESKVLGEVRSKVLMLAPRQEERLATQLRQIDEDHRNRRSAQNRLAMVLARVSPVSCYTHAVANLCQTGIFEPENFMDNAQRYQNQVAQAVYNNYVPWGSRLEYKEGFDRRNLPPLPDMVYSYPTLLSVTAYSWPDWLLLGLFPGLFYSLAYRKFSAYDVR